ncbi:Flap endonuclease 1 [Mycena sanguinolenta]|uniref:Flap endonuclease 1 n=1 Tax=Mycena sanguinolenta TaxID=230812 RepID=A0A8H6XQD4_9AGAR|nr:Flap endonuclease 1 [Mycena sanguinolenta]
MGVLGLTPFLQKAYPEVVKQLPRPPPRTRCVSYGWSHSDGTLITQRLHFAQVPHNYRHVLGWYRLVKELQDSGVSAICVFDGKERSAAKAREAERRRETKELALARGSIELDRVTRLQRLADVLGCFKKLDGVQKTRVSELLRQISSDPKLPPALASFARKGRRKDATNVLDVEELQESALSPQEEAASFSQKCRPTDESTLRNVAPSLLEVSLPPQEESVPLKEEEDVVHPTPTPLGTFTPSHKEPTSHPNNSTPSHRPKPAAKQDSVASFPGSVSSELLPSVPLPTSKPPPIEPPPQDEASAVVSPSNELDLAPASPPPTSRTPSSSSTMPSRPIVSPLERPFPGTSESPTRVAATSVDVDVPDVLAELYFDFRESVHKLASLTPTLPDASQSTDAEQREARVEYSMTKGQVQLTTDEAKLWAELAASTSPNDQVEEQVAKLSSRASVMSESYERRNNPPTAQTYDEAKELLRTMGIPCIDTSGTYEAEALASSLVLNGLADYVASEDTDVVIYEAPLIRNITNRASPLMLLSGSEIRAALELDRSSFIDFALLLGTDFSQRIKNVGPVRALKFIQQHKSIERVIEMEKKYKPRVPPASVSRRDAKLLEQVKDDEALSVVLQRFGLGKLLMEDEVWHFEDALEGNYFADDPSAW